MEDDLFFADISKQISLLIMEDEEEHQHPLALCSSVSFQEVGAVTSPFMYGTRRGSKGTGVFIPTSSQPRRKHHKHGRLRSFNSKSQAPQQRQENASTLSYNYNTSYTNASDPRRV